MFYAEMNKIWRPVIVIITVIISVLIFFSFMFGCIKPFQAFNGTDSLGVKLEICSGLIDKYGNSIEELLAYLKKAECEDNITDEKIQEIVDKSHNLL